MAVRQTAATKSNLHSSRGHAIFVLRVYNTMPGGGACAESQVYLCDLAGSERQKKTEASGKRLAEASKINTSLLSLRRVIDGLAKKKSSKSKRHIPYRDSKLTRILQNALGGTGRASIICNINPAANEAEEAMSTLRFGCSAANVTNHVVSRLRERPAHVWQALLREKDREIRRLKHDLACLARFSPAAFSYAMRGSATADIDTRHAETHHARATTSRGMDAHGHEHERHPWASPVGDSNGHSAVYTHPATPGGTGPPALVCPITQKPFVLPMVARDGYTYERVAILDHFQTVGMSSPVTKQGLSSTQLIPNRALAPSPNIASNPSINGAGARALVSVGVLARDHHRNNTTEHPSQHQLHRSRQGEGTRTSYLADLADSASDHTGASTTLRLEQYVMAQQGTRVHQAKEHFLDLPDDLLIVIFQYLPGHVLGTCERVCRDFSHLISGPRGQAELWKKVYKRMAATLNSPSHISQSTLHEARKYGNIPQKLSLQQRTSAAAGVTVTDVGAAEESVSPKAQFVTKYNQWLQETLASRTWKRQSMEQALEQQMLRDRGQRTGQLTLSYA